jgi:Zn-dependent protease with chaperone function
MSALQPLLVAAAVALALAVVIAAAVGLVMRAAAPVLGRGSSALWAALACAPFVVAAIASVALLLPDPLSGACHCAPHGDHHPHVCWTHPGAAEPLALPALAVLAGWLLLRGPAVGRALLAVARSSRLARTLRAAPAEEIDGIGVRVLDCGEPTAFTAGFWSPQIVVDRSLTQTLDAQSLRAVVHHEHAHAVRRDGLSLAALQLAAAWFPSGMLRGAVARWVSATEAECDRHAAAQIGSASDVAAALVAVERLRAGFTGTGRQLAPAIGSADLAHRVRALLGDGGRSANLASDVLSIAIVVSGLFLLAALWPGDGVHHLVETLLGRAFHW